MICPHCHNNIPNGSNVCPLCFSSLNGVADEPESSAGGTQNTQPAKEGRSSGAGLNGATAGRTKSRRTKKRDVAPMIIAIGLIVVLIVFVALIVRSMFTGGALFGGGQQTQATPAPTPGVQQNNLIIFHFKHSASPVCFLSKGIVEGSGGRHGPCRRLRWRWPPPSCGIPPVLPQFSCRLSG